MALLTRLKGYISMTCEYSKLRNYMTSRRSKFARVLRYLNGTDDGDSRYFDAINGQTIHLEFIASRELN